MRQVYATAIQCDLCKSTAQVTRPDSLSDPALPPGGWIGPVYMSDSYSGMRPYDFCPKCADMPFSQVHRCINQLEKAGS